MDLRYFRSLNDRVRSWLEQLSTRAFWLLLPQRIARFVWRSILAALHFLRRLLTGIAGRLSRFLDWPVRKALRLALVLGVLVFAGIWLALGFAIYYPSSQVAPDQPEHTIYYLNQGWGSSVDSELRQTFYYTPQGTSLLGTGFRYSWLTHLEQAGRKQLFIAPEHMRAMGFQVDNVPTPANPENLPVGFTRHFAPEFNDEVLDITCAACHTGELHARVHGENAGIRIDGGQAMHAFTSTVTGQFGPTLTAAMAATLLNPFKFVRFARGVLRERYPEGRAALAGDFAKVLFSLLSQTADDLFHNRYPIEEGFGRVDAIGRIANAAFGTELDASNFAPGNAPVSYPAIWTAHYWDWVQYTACCVQPMSRNVGESLGVGATLGLVSDREGPLPEADRFVSSTLIRNLKKIEDTIAKLEAPQWPEDLLGKVDREKAAAGKVLFEKRCAMCHEPCNLPASEIAVERPLLIDEKTHQVTYPLWHIKAVPVDEIGTDPQAAMNFVNRRINLEKTGLTREQVQAKVRDILEQQQARKKKHFEDHRGDKTLKDPGDGKCEINKQVDAVNVASATIGQALNYVQIFIQDKYYKELGISTEHSHKTDEIRDVEEYNGDGALDLPRVLMVYKPRPLGGVWATAPYLHNGSVPTLYDLLSPANERPRKFFIRNRMDFDPVRVGLVSSPAYTKGFWFDTTIPGNRNNGHEFRAGYGGSPPRQGVIGPELTPGERWQIIEYLKIYKETPQPCSADALPPAPVQECEK